MHEARSDDDGKDIPVSNYDEARMANAALNNSKSAVAERLPRELFKYDTEDNQQTMSMHQLLCTI